jgi:hypothetical protein
MRKGRASALFHFPPPIWRTPVEKYKSLPGATFPPPLLKMIQGTA